METILTYFTDEQRKSLIAEAESQNLRMLHDRRIVRTEQIIQQYSISNGEDENGNPLPDTAGKMLVDVDIYVKDEIVFTDVSPPFTPPSRRDILINELIALGAKDFQKLSKAERDRALQILLETGR